MSENARVKSTALAKLALTIVVAGALLAGWYRTSGRRRPVAARPARVA